MATPSVILDAIAEADAQTSNVGLPTYRQLAHALAQIERLTREGVRGGDTIRDAVGEVAARMVAPNAMRYALEVARES